MHHAGALTSWGSLSSRNARKTGRARDKGWQGWEGRRGGADVPARQQRSVSSYHIRAKA